MQERDNAMQIQESTQMLIAKWQGKVPEDTLLSLQERLANLQDDNQIALLNFIQLKSPAVGVVLGLCLVWIVIGMDRFYKGDIWLGILKLFGVPILFVCGGIAVFACQQGGVFFIFLIPIVLWIIVDFFLVYKGIKKDNFERINNQLLLFGV